MLVFVGKHFIWSQIDLTCIQYDNKESESSFLLPYKKAEYWNSFIQNILNYLCYETFRCIHVSRTIAPEENCP